MNYHDLLELYKTGQLDESTRKALENDIEKQDAISDYLFSNADIPELDALLPTQGPQQDETLFLIQKSIRRAFIKMGIVVGSIVVTLILFIVFILPGLANRFYYRPDETIGTGIHNENIPRFNRDLAVCTELFLPGRERSYAAIRPEGWGNYEITIPDIFSNDGRFSSVSGNLEHGRLSLYDPNFLRLPEFNTFRLPKEAAGSSYSEFGYTGEFLGAAGTWEDMYKALDGLVDNQKYRAYISLTEITNFEELWPQLSSHLDAGFWCGVFTEDKNGQLIAPNIGFNLFPMDQGFVWSQKEEGEKYPLLSLVKAENGVSSFCNDPSQYEPHFISLLCYLRDHPQLIELFGLDPTVVGTDQLDQMIESVRQNGLRIYGFSAELTKEQLLQLRDDPAISYIYTTPLY